MIAHKTRYLGVPEHLLPRMEEVAQGTVTALYTACQQLAEKQGKTHDYGDADYTIRIDTVPAERKATHQRLRLQDHSSGWWAIAQWGSPFPDLDGYLETVDFWFVAKQGKPKAKYTWDGFQSDWGYGRCDLFMRARRMEDSGTWSGDVHALDFKHPFLFHLRMALEELEGS